MDDMISRQAMKNMITNHWSDFSNAANYRTALACVDAVPTINPEPKRAKWIATTETRSGQIGWMVYKCSNCSHYRRKPMNYCEVCGAKMER